MTRRTGGPGGCLAPRVAAAAALVGLAACGGGGGGPPPTTTTRPGPTTTTTTPATTAAPAPTAGPGPTSTRPRPAPTTTTAPPAGPSGVGGGDGSGAAAAGPTPPGRYSYETAGRFTGPLGASPRDGETVLTVDPPAGARQRSVRRGPDRTVEQVLEARADGTYLVSLRITDGGFAQEVRPPTPVLALPAPAPVGREWAWQAPTADGATTVSSSFRVVRAETIAVGGRAVPTQVVEATVTSTGAVSTSGRQTFWYSPSDRLIVVLQEVTDATVAGLAFRSESTERLRSLQPG